jgi:glycosyltransferase involved in cell wall biosynthesis
LNHPCLADRKRSVRLLNTEHLYYRSLADNESNFVKKQYYRLEAFKLRKYEAGTFSSVSLLPISGHDFDFFKGFNTKVILIPPFHPYEEVISNTGKGEYILFHGDLSVRENELIARSLIRNVFSGLKYNCIIAGKKPPQTLLSEAEGVKPLRIIADPRQSEMEDLIKNAHINVLPSLTSNGFKLKHLFALFAGRYCILNSTAAQNFEDRSIFHIADSDEEMIRMINQLMLIDFPNDIVSNRKKSLEKTFSNKRNATRLAEVVFG